ncbi:MAG: geranylgeranyl reductase family protein [Candidatus Thorarchaeota archaeon]|nr:MAG: geranylgeranyl reductase family protein [Candidatus Thorarchaeota archaeon]
MHDLVIVGGGPAGTTCARRAALNGLDVLLIEKEVHPRQKLCGGALTQRVTELIDFSIEHAVQTDFCGGRIYSQSGEFLEGSLKDYTGYLVDRKDFDLLLLQEARKAGVQVEEGVEVVAVEQTKTGIRVLTVGDSYKAHLLVGADGVNGVVARLTGLRDRWTSESVALCIATDIPMEQDEIVRTMSMTDSEFLGIDLHFGIIDIGYGWCFPKKNKLNVGIGCRMDKAAGLRDHWNSFLKRVEKLKDVSLKVPRRSAFRVPFGGRTRRHVARRTMLVGDAAGFVSPVTGEGIYYAMLSGLLAADVASEAAEMKMPYHLMTYEKRLKESILSELNIAAGLSEVLYRSRKNVELVFSIARSDPKMQQHILDFVGGVRSYSQIRRDMVRRMLSRHPLKTLRLRL